MDKIKLLDDYLKKLEHSKFRSSFHLRKYMISYIDKVGMEKIREHATSFIDKNLSVRLDRDGTQTPMKGHPVFIAQHATATCCRTCIEKWYHIPKDRPLTQNEKNFILDIIMLWIKKEYKK